MDVFNLQLLKIEKQFYKEVKASSLHPLLLVLGQKQELLLFEAFFKYQLSAESTGEDLFLLQQQVFDDPTTYGESILNEWVQFYEAWRGQESTAPTWDDAHCYAHIDKHAFKTDAYKVFYALEGLLNLFPWLQDQYVFIQLAPIEGANHPMLKVWIQEWCALAQKHEKLKLIFTDHEVHRFIGDIDYAHRYSLQIDMQQMMQSAAALSNVKKGNNLEGEYQQQLLLASGLLEKNEYDKAIIALKRAIELAKKTKNIQLLTVALMMLAEVYASQHSRVLATETFEEAIETAQSNFLKCQVYLIYGAFLINISKKEKAKEEFEKAIALAQENDEFILVMEGHRLIAQLSKGFFSSSKYIEHLELALAAGRQLPKESLGNSSIMYIADLLIKFYGEKSTEGRRLDEELKNLVSADWRVSCELHEAVKK